MFDLSNYPLAVIFSIGLAAILIVGEIGWQLGIHAKGEAGSNFSTLESAMLGLLALMLAFTFSMALTRFEARRDALLNEANAIGTTAPTAPAYYLSHNVLALKYSGVRVSPGAVQR